MLSRRIEAEFFFWATRLAVLFFLPAHVTDIPIYLLDVGRFFLDGQLPYRDFPFEYPPLTYAFFFLPAWLAKSVHWLTVDNYRFLFGILLLPFDYAVLRGFLRNPPFDRAALLYAFLTALLAQLLYDRIDVGIAAAIALPFLWGDRRDGGLFGLGWGVGGALKLVPLLLVPFRVLEEWSGPLTRWCLVAFLPLSLSTLFVLGFSGGQLSFLSYHGQRGVQVESFLGNLWLCLHRLGFAPAVRVETLFRSQQVVGVPGLDTAGKFLFWSLLITTYLVLLRTVARGRFSSLRATWLFLLTFVTFGYVLSPQFFFWLIPLAILVASELRPRERARFLGAFGLLVFMTAVHFARYWSYADLHAANLFWLAARNGFLIAFWISSWIWFPSPGGAARLSATADPLR